MAENPNLLQIDRLNPAAFRALDRGKTIAVIPFAPIEYHGDHLPLGTDYILACNWYRWAAEEFAGAHEGWKFLFHPALALGSDAVPHGGSMWVTPEVVRAVAKQLGERYAAYGFKFIALLSGHGGFSHTAALEDAARKLNRKFKKQGAKVFCPLGLAMQEGMTEERLAQLSELLAEPIAEEDRRQMKYEGHGGRMETSMILELAPELMGDDYKTAVSHEPELNPVAKMILENIIPSLPGAVREKIGDGADTLAVAISWLINKAEKGYMGYPSRASAADGAAFLKVMTSVFLENLENICLRGASPKVADEMYLIAKSVGAREERIFRGL